jgi:DNA-binding transcriptional ArsR family regulator
LPICSCNVILACGFTREERIHDTDLLFKALADPSRRKLLDLLHAHDGRTLNQLCEHLDMTRQGVTQHLNVLEAANLVATVRRGREKLHFLNPVPLQAIYERWIAKFERPRLKALHGLKRRLEKTNG